MAKKLRAGKSSELIVAGELIRNGLDVYMPYVDDQAIDLIIRSEIDNEIKYYDIQIKSVKGYNRIIGLKNIEEKNPDYILIIHYRHDNKPDEFFYLTKDQIIKHYLKDSDWGDLIFNKPEREKYKDQIIANLADKIIHGNIWTSIYKHRIF